MAAELAQMYLRSGTTVRTCWLDARVKARDQVTLRNSEDPSRWWDVVRVEEGRRTVSEINRGWSNNI